MTSAVLDSRLAPDWLDPPLSSVRRRRRRVLVALVAAVLFSLVAAALAVWIAGLVQNFHAVVPGEVYRSAQPTAQALERWRKEINLATVVNLRGAWPGERWYDEEKEACRRLGIEHHDVGVATHQLAPLGEVRRLAAILDACPKPVLLHCRHGSDRTALAVAIDQILRYDRSLEEAKGSYSIFYGHTGWAWGYQLPHLFDCYRQWLKERGAEHSPDLFREWIATEPAVAHFHAKIEAEGIGDQTPVGEAIAATFRAENKSRHPWVAANGSRPGVRLVVRVRQGREVVDRVEARSSKIVIPPGDSAVFETTLRGFAQPGEYLIDADLVEAGNFRFERMGIGGWARRMVAKP